MLMIDYSDEQQLSKGDLGAKVQGDKLLLPPELEPLMKQCNIRNATALYGILDAFPTSFAVTCGWTIDETLQAKETLKSQLRGHVSDAILDFDPASLPKRSFGARAPEDHPIQPGYQVPPPKKNG